MASILAVLKGVVLVIFYLFEAFGVSIQIKRADRGRQNKATSKVKLQAVKCGKLECGSGSQRFCHGRQNRWC